MRNIVPEETYFIHTPLPPVEKTQRETNLNEICHKYYRTVPKSPRRWLPFTGKGRRVADQIEETMRKQRTAHIRVNK